MKNCLTTFMILVAAAAACSESNEEPSTGCQPGAGGDALAGSAGSKANDSGAGVPASGGKHSSVGGAPEAAGAATAAGAAPELEAGACGTSNDAGGAAGEASWQLRALTYNTALAPDFEPLTSERKPQIEAALADAAQQLDLLCVQEYWAGSDFEELSQALAAELPNEYRQSPKPGSGSCTPGDLGALGGCLTEKCADKASIELVACAQQQCASAIQSIDGGCLGCFLEHLEDQGFETCLAEAPKDPALFGGTFDVGLLSRYPLVEKAAFEYDAYFVRASALYAQVEVPGLGPVDTFCTHLGSSLGVIPYQGAHGSWDGEHSYQTAQLLAFVAQKASAGRPILVLGDLNTGPAGAGASAISAELPLDYQLLVGSGLSSAFEAPKCTLCADNALRGAGSRELWLDHALLKGWTGKANAERALTQTFELVTPAGPVAMNLSDHYGVRVELRSE